MSKPEQVKEYFEDLAKKPYISQLRLKAMIDQSNERHERSSLIRKLVVGDCRGESVEMEIDIDENTIMVLKSSEFKDGLYYATDFFFLENKTVKKSCEYYKTKDGALLAGLIIHQGGTDTVIGAVEYMIKGCQK